jgi:CheY-like chemotaxis protein
MHGGEVRADSPGPGKGAVFTVRLPRVDPAATTLAAGVARPAGTATRRILVVDDNDDAREMLRVLLSMSGHEVIEARNGRDGIELAEAHGPDVALVDIGLPDLDGYEVARRLRAAPGGRRMGLIAITGYGQPEDQRRAYEAGFDAHLTKPVAPERLRQVMAGLR